MSLHSYMFPACDVELKHALADLEFWKGEAKRFEKQLASERRRNLEREDKLLNAALAASGRYGIGVREDVPIAGNPGNEAPASNEVANYAMPVQDEEREQEITLIAAQVHKSRATHGVIMPLNEVRDEIAQNAKFWLDPNAVEM